MAKAANGSAKPMTKSEVLNAVAEATGMKRKEVVAVMDALADQIGKALGKRGPGVFNLYGLMRIKVVRKPATKAREGINPFTGEKMMFKAKPARNVVKVSPMKALKSMV
jgi:nucleoid DNA-binding protein